MVAVEHRMNVLETKVSYLDIQENFNPEVGFVPRADSRRLKGSVRYRPRSQLEWIRRYSMGPRLTYLMDQNQVLQTRDFEFSSYVNLEAGAQVQGISGTFEAIVWSCSPIGGARFRDGSPMKAAIFSMVAKIVSAARSHGSSVAS